MAEFDFLGRSLLGLETGRDPGQFEHEDGVGAVGIMMAAHATE